MNEVLGECKRFPALAHIAATALAVVAVAVVVAFALSFASLASVPRAYAADAAAPINGDSLNGTNWMSGIPDDRYLHEINIPGTHDSSMKDSWGRENYQSLSIAYVYAETQHMYLDEQLDAGVRGFDIRLTDIPPKAGYDTTHTVYNCHGNEREKLDCLYFSRDKNKNFITFEATLNMMCDFLEAHPTETIILGVSREHNSGTSEEAVLRKAQGIIDSFYKRDNPKTRKSFIYTENGNKILTNMPRLSQVRGQIVITTSNATGLGYGFQYNTSYGWGDWGSIRVGDVPFAYENHYEEKAAYKRDIVRAFIAGGTTRTWKQGSKTTQAHTQALPRDVSWHLPYGTILMSSSSLVLFAEKTNWSTPGQVADKVNPILYTDDNAFFKTRGVHYGWVFSDYVKAEDVRLLWLTNYPSDLNYAKITYSSEKHDTTPISPTSVIAGTTITLPENPYPAVEGLDFLGWSVNGDDPRQPGERVSVIRDANVVAKFGMTWKSLQKLVNQHTGSPHTITLPNDVVATKTDKPLVIPANADITIDLNGHNINRNWTDESRASGAAIVLGMGIPNSAKLTLTGEGKVTGGGGAGTSARFQSGGIVVTSRAVLTLKGKVQVTQNQASDGAGVYVKSGGTLNMAENASITDNDAHGGESSVDGTSSSGMGGGVYLSDKRCTLNVSDSAVISGNRNGAKSESNVYLPAGVKMNVTGALTPGARFGVSTPQSIVGGAKVVVTSGLNGKGDLANFVSDKADCRTHLNEQREVELGGVYTATFDTRDGEQKTTQGVFSGEKVVKPEPDPVYAKGHMPGYNPAFKYWYSTDPDTPFDFDTPIAADITLSAKWAAPIHTVTFKSEGAVLDTKQVEGGKPVAKPADPTREGYVFRQWRYTVESKSVSGISIRSYPYDFSKPVASSLVLEAEWAPNTYSVTFDLDGGTAAESQTQAQSVAPNGKAVKPAPDPVKEGFDFAGWYAGDSLYDFDQPVKGNLALKAHWMESGSSTPELETATVTFVVDGAQSTQQAVVGGYVDAPATDPTKEGFLFDGWYADYDSLSADDIAEIESDSALSQWCWVVGNTLRMEYDFDTPIEGDITLYARWYAQTCTIAFDLNDGSEDEDRLSYQPVAYGEVVDAPVDPAREHYAFDGWYTDAAFTTLYGFGRPVVGDITLFAKWVPETCTVTFESNGGTEVASQQVKYDDKAEAPAEPTLDGFMFGNWYSDPDLQTEFDFATTQIKEDTVLYASWTPQEYTVAFDAKGGSAVASQTLEFGSSLSEVPDDPTRDGYEFAGWYEDITSELSVDDCQAIIEQDPGLADLFWIDGEKVLMLCDLDDYVVYRAATLYARWSQWFTVSFDTGDESSAIDSQTVLAGQKAQRPDDPTAEGHVFAGWFTDAELTNAYDFESPVNANLELKAKWEERPFIVTFVDQDDVFLAEQEVAKGGTAVEPEVEWPGYSFSGWYSDPAHTSAYSFDTPIYDDTVVYGLWEEESYTVTFDVNGGQPDTIAPVTAAYDELIEKPVNPTRDGYVFLGWYEDWSSVLTPQDAAEFASDEPDYPVDFVVSDGKVLLEYNLDEEPVCYDLDLQALWAPVGSLEVDVVLGEGVPAVKAANLEQVALATVPDSEILRGVRVWLEVSALSEADVPAADKDLIAAKAADLGAQPAIWLDVSLYKQVEGGEAVEIHVPAEPVELSLDVPNSLRTVDDDTTRTFHLLHAHDGEASEVASSKNGVLAGSTDGFSTFAIAYGDKSSGSVTPQDPDPEAGEGDKTPGQGDSAVKPTSSAASAAKSKGASVSSKTGDSIPTGIVASLTWLSVASAVLAAFAYRRFRASR